MTSSVLVVCVLIALGAGLCVVCLESPVRCAGALVGVFCGAAGALVCVGVPLVPGFSLWIGVAGVALPLLSTVLFLNLLDPGRGIRRLALTRALGLFVLVYVATALAALVMRAADALVAGPPVAAARVAAALVDEGGVALALATLALVAAVLGALSVARRRA